MCVASFISRESLSSLVVIHFTGKTNHQTLLSSFLKFRYGAWGKATPDGNLMQLRALDWDVEGPFQNYPQITVYHARDKSDGNTFANIGWCVVCSRLCRRSNQAWICTGLNTLRHLPF